MASEGSRLVRPAWMLCFEKTHARTTHRTFLAFSPVKTAQHHVACGYRWCLGVLNCSCLCVHRRFGFRIHCVDSRFYRAWWWSSTSLFYFFGHFGGSLLCAPCWMGNKKKKGNNNTAEKQKKAFICNTNRKNCLCLNPVISPPMVARR